MEGDPFPDIEWFVDDDKIKKGGRFDFLSNGDLVTLKISETSAEDEGEYKCTAKNENGMATTSAELIVNGKSLICQTDLCILCGFFLWLTDKCHQNFSCHRSYDELMDTLYNNYLKRK